MLILRDDEDHCDEFTLCNFISVSFTRYDRNVSFGMTLFVGSSYIIGIQFTRLGCRAAAMLKLADLLLLSYL